MHLILLNKHVLNLKTFQISVLDNFWSILILIFFGGGVGGALEGWWLDRNIFRDLLCLI